MGPDVTQLREALRVDDRHQIPELPRLRSGHDVQWPNKPFAGQPCRRPVFHELANRLSLSVGRLFGVVPLHHQVPAGTARQIRHSLAPFAELFLDRELPAQSLRRDSVTNE